MPAARFSYLLLLVPAFSSAPLAAQVSPLWSKCRSDTLSTYNCAQYYSGTVSLTSSLTHAGSTTTVSITAAVASGRVTCRTMKSGEPPVEAGGMLAVQHDGTLDAGGYEVLVWCPEGSRARLDRTAAPTIAVRKVEAADYAILSGKDQYEHPDADSVNGVTGTETVSWNLRRQ